MKIKIVFLLIIITSGLLNSAHARDWIYRVHAGETLLMIGELFLKPVVSINDLQTYNEIENEKNIPVGTEIKIPLVWMRNPPTAVKVLHLQGHAVFFRRDGEHREQLKLTTELNAGDRLFTEIDASVELEFADGSKLLVGPGSEVEFDTLSSHGDTGMVDTILRLQRGRIENQVKPFKRPDSRYQIQTPAAVTMVRDTIFRVQVDAASGQTQNEVVEGLIEVEAAGKKVALAAGEGVQINSGEAPQRPQPLLGRPVIERLPAFLQSDTPVFDWLPMTEAMGYRVKIVEAGSNKVAFNSIFGDTHIAVPKLPDGYYILQVRAIDRMGLEGLTSSREFFLGNPDAAEKTADESPKAATELEVKDEAEVRRVNPRLERPIFHHGWVWFDWDPVPGAWSYLLLLSRDFKAEKPIFERLSNDTNFHMPMPEPGRYYVRVDALFEDRSQISRSNSYRLEIPGWRR